MKGKTPMNHYKFLEKLILAKICPREHGSPRRRGLSVAAQRGDKQSLGGRGHSKKRNSTSSSKRTAADSVSTASKRKPPATYVTSARVSNPSHLFHSMRLNRDVCHMPGPVVKSASGLAPSCALCRWATGKQFREQVSYCESCSTVLCVWCYKRFHTVEDLEGKREDICNGILNRKRFFE